ncbi:glycosyltransferase family 2 protein [Kaistella sp. 97-N-M2]|uniref:glycosyltransferase family A protein n=1 Tax=Kaistella sp. 97-N-M2 TaxID=2908645 RepID=UPI001F1CA612|nr:glycosyltransferase family A protein [Kaistella sp. 97-N-M2]UJF28768.1 glycosyltransferase family 2 protein [Kaistella sp. 97-N-M2]
MKLTIFNIWLYNVINNIFYRSFDLYCNPIVRKQLKQPKQIPIIIINFNQLFYLKQLVDFLFERNFNNIVIIDNRSTYPPLLRYYEEISNDVEIEFMEKNYGHAVFFKNKVLQKKYGKGFYVVTDADVIPNENLPADFLKHMIIHLKKHWSQITKVGFALKLDDIPKENLLKQKILKWEAKFWQNKQSENIYIAPIDTTFALYKPGYPRKYDQVPYLNAHRFANSFVAKHGGWYVNQSNLTEEQQFYAETASMSSSWLQNNQNL